MESEERGAHVQGFGWEAIEKKCGCGKSIGPIGGGHGCLNEQGAGDIVDGANHALGFAILL
jgi:hypothetical protein